MRKLLKRAALSLLLPMAAAAQGQRIPELAARLDRSAVRTSEEAITDTSWRFDVMSPGWHVTTGPGLLLFDTTQSPAGRFSVEAVMYMFPNPSAEGMGVFAAGSGLAGGEPAYVALLIRRDGQFQLEQRQGNQTRALIPWRADTALKAHPGGSEVVEYKVRMMLTGDSLVAYVNDRRLGAALAPAVSFAGRFGLRIGPRLNVHVATLNLIRHLAR